MKRASDEYLSKREQQIMAIVYQRGEVSVADVMEALPDPLSNSAVRTFLRILERKGHLRHVEREGRYIYLATRPRQNAARSALSQVLHVFFDGSVEKVMATLLSEKEGDLTPEELDRLEALIAQAKGEGR
jgi:BlaI family transcriptional regulator, penicillinase repressor